MVPDDTRAFIERVNEAFAHHDVAFFETHVAEDVRWTVVGEPTVIEGKAAFIDRLRAPDDSPPGIITISNMIECGTSVVVEGELTSHDETGSPSLFGYCDIYRLSEREPGIIEAITAYVVPLGGPGTS